MTNLATPPYPAEWRHALSKKVSESARQRETFRYDPSLHSRRVLNESGATLPGLSPSQDSVLTALAQLVLWQTGTSRSLISLFDDKCEYFIGEATTSLPIVPLPTQDSNDQDLWMCGTAIPRAHSFGEYTLLAKDPAQFEYCREDKRQWPVLVVPDLAKDPRFSDSPYCRPGSPARFYAAVPIRTYRGINIGVLSVFNPEPNTPWTEHQSQLLRNTALTVMAHLDTNRSKSAHRRSERMVRGLGFFVEGKSVSASWNARLGRASVAEGAMGDEDTAARHAAREKFEKMQEKEKREVDHHIEREPIVHQEGDSDREGHDGGSREGLGSKGKEKQVMIKTPTSTRSPSPNTVLGDATDTIDPYDPFAPKKGSTACFGIQSLQATPERVSTANRKWREKVPSSSNPMVETFSEAAIIIRESLETDGCLFLDATLGSFGAFDGRHHHYHEPKRPGQQCSSSETSTSSSSSSSSSDYDDDDDETSPAEQTWPPCQVLGFSTIAPAKPDVSDNVTRNVSMAQRFLAKLLHRYPKGNIFNFDANGELQTSDNMDDEAWLEPVSPHALGRTQPAESQAKTPRKPWARQNEGRAILEVFPRARSVAFVPVWDPRKQRWCAGGFVYTVTPTRIFTIEGELNYLRAFGILAIAETLRMKTLVANQAKSDALGSLSHELRSPLHGAVLGIELLRDTELTVFQGNVAHTIETCCRTLVDTVDHLLDYSKVNKFMQSKRKDTEPRGLRQIGARTVEEGMLSLYKHIKLDDVVEEVMDGVYAGYNFQHMSVTQLSQHKTGSHSDLTAIRRLDTMQAMEELGPNMTDKGDVLLRFGEVSVYLDIDPTCSWRFYTQPGAIRRIVMNLFGNALKYTRKGTIKVSLTQQEKEIGKKGSQPPETMISITVADTGKGISDDYLRNELYKPFSQEDHLAPGTGLGLSFVKQITSQLRGQVTVESKVDVGTTVRVSLPLTRTPPSAEGLTLSHEYEREYETQVHELDGLEILLVGFNTAKKTGERPLLDGTHVDQQKIVENICREWLRLKIIAEDTPRTKVPDIVLWEEESLTSSLVQEAILAGPPCVVVCTNALVAYKSAAHFENIKGGGIFEFISQPIGPHKLSKALTLALKRWKDAPAQTQIFPVSPLSPRPDPMNSANLSYGQYARAMVSSSTGPKILALRDNNKIPTIAAPPIPEVEEAPPEFLLVEDNNINLDILSIYMKKLGKTFRTATNGQEAFDAYRERPEQCKYIFMDISMPIMDGFEATRRIRAYERENSLKPSIIFALTGLASEGAQQEALGSGVDLFLTKPVKLKELGLILTSRGLLGYRAPASANIVSAAAAAAAAAATTITSTTTTTITTTTTTTMTTDSCPSTVTNSKNATNETT